MHEENELVAQWLSKASDDLRAAELLLTADSPVCWVAAFHAQQAAEKLLKALLTHERVEYERSHNIDYLLDLCVLVEPRLAELRESANTLTDYAVDSRYPLARQDPTLLEAKQAVETAKEVRDLVCKVLGGDSGRGEEAGD
jgi:HEPN domain-containing protein